MFQIIRNGQTIELTEEEARNVFFEVQNQYLLEDALNVMGEDLYSLKGLPHELMADPRSPYYILDEVVRRYKDEESLDVAASITFSSVIADIAMDMRERIENGMIPFAGDKDSLEVMDEAFLSQLHIEKNDDFQLEENGINFLVDGFSIDVDKTFGLHCNTEDNDDYVNVYLNWKPDPTGFSENQMGSIQMVVIYQADTETREMNVNLSAEHQNALLRRLPDMVAAALTSSLEDIHEEWVENVLNV